MIATATAFWILFISQSSGRGTDVTIENYATEEQCESVRSAIIEHASSWWNGQIDQDEIYCWEAK